MKDDQDIIIKVALIEQSFLDIRNRLEKIEDSLVDLKKAANMGLGAWKGLVLVGSMVGAIWSFIKITKL